MKFWPEIPTKNDPEVINVDNVALEIEGPHRVDLEQLTAAELPLKFAKDKTILTFVCKATKTFVQIMLEDIHLVDSTDETDI
jgi:hypothetical protein